MKKIFPVILALLAPLILHGQQQFEVPEDYSFTDQQSYIDAEPPILECIDWLQKTPFASEPDKRHDANAFFLKWVYGTPILTVAPTEKIARALFSNADGRPMQPHYFVIFAGAWARCVLQDPDIKWKELPELSPETLTNLNEAGVNAVIDFYLQGKAKAGRDIEVEKLVKMREKGTLREFIEKDKIAQ